MPDRLIGVSGPGSSIRSDHGRGIDQCALRRFDQVIPTSDAAGGRIQNLAESLTIRVGFEHDLLSDQDNAKRPWQNPRQFKRHM